MYYQLHPDLPAWALEVIKNTAIHNNEYISEALANLSCENC
ncbi:putative transcriptional regulator [Alteromonas macleodii]|nr:putative transcriptional regulator [Alteromonas macleodii]